MEIQEPGGAAGTAVAGRGTCPLWGPGQGGAPPRSAAGAGRRGGLRLRRLTGFVQGLAVYPLSK